MCLPLLELCGGGPPGHHHHPPGGPPHHPGGGPGWGGPGGYSGFGGNPIVDCVCCPCNLVCYFFYALQEIGNCFCGLCDCFRYERRPGYGPPHHHHY